MSTVTPDAPDGNEAMVCVLLTPRHPGGHEAALLAWLGEAVQQHGLRPWLVASTAELASLCRAAGLARWLAPCGPAHGHSPWRAVAWALRAWPRHKPLLLAPGVLHVQAWLQAALRLQRRPIWVYVPMVHTARHMGYRWGGLRDRLLRPWLAGVQGWIVLDAQQVEALRGDWRCRDATCLVLPNLARVEGPPPAWPAPEADGCLRVAVVGRFDAWQKGLDWLAAQLLARPAWATALRWRFQGRGPDAPLLQALAAQLGALQVQLKGHGPLDEALKASDVLLLPSRYEGLPLVALETLQRGWPVVASRAAGLNALLAPEALFDLGDAAGLARALALQRDPARRQAQVAHARSRMAAARWPLQYRVTLRELCQRWANSDGWHATRARSRAARPC